MPFGTQDISLTQGLNRKPTILTVHMTVYSQQTLVDTGDHLSGTCKSLLCNALHQGRLCAVQHSMCPGNPVQRSSVPQTVEAWSDKSGLKNELSVSSSGAQPRRQQACTRERPSAAGALCCMGGTPAPHSTIPPVLAMSMQPLFTCSDTPSAISRSKGIQTLSTTHIKVEAQPVPRLCNDALRAS